MIPFPATNMPACGVQRRYMRNGIDFDHNMECGEMLKLLHEMLHRKIV